MVSPMAPIKGRRVVVAKRVLMKRLQLALSKKGGRSSLTAKKASKGKPGRSRPHQREVRNGCPRGRRPRRTRPKPRRPQCVGDGLGPTNDDRLGALHVGRRVALIATAESDSGYQAGLPGLVFHPGAIVGPPQEARGRPVRRSVRLLPGTVQRDSTPRRRPHHPAGHLGGAHALWNLAPACLPCNFSKGRSHPVAFILRRAEARQASLRGGARRHRPSPQSVGEARLEVGRPAPES